MLDLVLVVLFVGCSLKLIYDRIAKNEIDLVMLVLIGLVIFAALVKDVVGAGDTALHWIVGMIAAMLIGIPSFGIVVYPKLLDMIFGKQDEQPHTLF